MIDSTRIREGMVVYSSEGEKLGKVLSCDRESFVIEKGFFFPKDYIARYEDVADVSGDDVRLLCARAALESGDASVPHDRSGQELGYGAAGAAPSAVEGGMGMNASGAGLGATRAELPDVATGASALGAGSAEYEARRESSGERAGDEPRMTVAEEELDVVKRDRPAGEARLTKDVITETKRIDVPVTREEVRVERAPLAEPRAAQPGEAAFEQQTISVPVREEEVEIRKRPVVREEVRLRKDRVVEQRAAEADVRKERVDVQDTSRAIRDEDRDPHTRE